LCRLFGSSLDVRALRTVLHFFQCTSRGRFSRKRRNLFFGSVATLRKWNSGETCVSPALCQNRKGWATRPQGWLTVNVCV